jgi:ubiquinone/menaquinone biosynthesis C-methylase UbiE
MFDAVVSESVLEHVADPWTVAEEIYRVLKPGGVIRVDSAFLQPFHGDPSHYFNMTVPGIERVFRRFQKLRSGVDTHQAPSFSIRMLLEQYRTLIHDPTMKERIGEFLALPFEQTDRELSPAEHRIVGAGVYFEGRKHEG